MTGVRDLSGMLPANPVTPSSMVAVNTTSQDGTGFTGPGSPSEVIKEGDIGQVPSLAEIAADSPRSVIVGSPGVSLGEWNYVPGVDRG